MGTKRADRTACPLSIRLKKSCRLLAGLGRRGNRSGLGAGQNRVGAGGADVEHGQADGGEHENDRRPGGEPSEDVGCGAGTKSGLRTLAAESACEVSRTALL